MSCVQLDRNVSAESMLKDCHSNLHKGSLQRYRSAVAYFLEISKMSNSLLQVPLPSYTSTEDLYMLCMVGVSPLTSKVVHTMR